MLLGRIAPRRRAALQPCRHQRRRFAQANGQILRRVQALAEEKWDHHQILRLRHSVAFLDQRRFFEKNRLDLGVISKSTDHLHLTVGRLARPFGLRGAVSGQDERGFLRSRRARERMPLDYVARPSQDDLSDGRMRADGSAVMKDLLTALLPAGEVQLTSVLEPERDWNSFLGEIAFAEKERHEEYP